MVFGLFSKEKSLERTIDKATNKLAQSADRWAAMEKLSEMGTDEALIGLCKRFSFVSLKGSEDEQEKQWTVDTMVGKGPMVLPALRKYMKNAAALSYPLAILERVASPGEVLDAVDEILASEEPGYTRDPSRRLDVIQWLGEWKAGKSEDIAARVTPYLSDFDENTRFAVADTLALHPVQEAGPPLVAALVREEEESGRLKVRIAEVLAEGGYDLGEHKAAVSAMLDGVLSEFRLHHDKLEKKSA